MESAGNNAETSIYRRQLDEGFSRLRFFDRLECEFRTELQLAGLKQLRIVLAIGFMFGMSIAVFDYFYGGRGFSSSSVPLRAAVNQPLILLMIAATFFSVTHRFLTPLGVILGLVIPGGSYFLSTVAQLQGVGTAITGQLVGTFYVYFFLGLRFWPAAMTAGTIMTAFFVVAIVASAPPAAIFYNGIFLVFTNLIGALGLYNLEYSRRESFLEARQLEHLSLHDPMTGIANRKAFEINLETAWAHCKRERQTLLIAMVDIDCFKDYNDSYGHQAGDRCLTLVAQELDKIGRRPLDLVARYGGEEFVILLPGCTLDDGMRLIDIAREHVQALNIAHRASTTARAVTVSAGIAHVQPSRTSRSPQGVLQLADEALYRAKQAGRNRVVAAEPEQADTARTGIFRLDPDARSIEVAET
jgi:diguanylate cyclase (GGDEF)-like protein